MTSVQYRQQPGGSALATYTYGFDAMGRLNTMTDQSNNSLVSGVTYNAANKLLTLSGTVVAESRTYNVNQQLTELYSGSYHFKYNYSATQNNGRIQSMTDVASGETVTYAYDTLNRLITASGTGDAQGNWSQTFGYDGFGNLLSKTGVNAPNVTSWVVDPTTNRITNNGALYYANGNLGQYAGSFYGYDIANRLVMATPQGGSASQRYAYDSSNHRIYAGTTSDNINYTNEQIYFYGADGKKLGVWSLTWLNSAPVLTNTVINQWFGGRLLKPQDRLQSRGKYFPYGEDRYNPNPANPANDQEKFATYTRDSATGLDYANQRYYGAGVGRFTSPDPYGGSASVQAPQTLNRFVYANDDPIRNFDPTGLICSADEDNCEGGEDEDGGNDGGGGGGSFFSWSGGYIPLDPPSDFTECNGRGNPVTEKKLNFIYNNFSDALNAANNFEQGVQGSKVGATALATMFLQWSVQEGGYPGDSRQVTAENNWFGFQRGGPGGWSGLEISCPESSDIPDASTNACFSTATSWGQELSAALSTPSSKTSITYGQALESALAAGLTSTAMLLQAIADNGWNGKATYGADITRKISLKPQVDCLEKNGYIP